MQSRTQRASSQSPCPSARGSSPMLTASDASSVAEIVASCVPNWSGRPVHVASLSGGTTNAVWKCWAEGDEESAVLARVYGPRTEVLIDRAIELRLCSLLGRNGLTERVYGSFGNGFVVGYVRGRVLTYSELPEYHSEIAAELARWHAFDASEALGSDRTPKLWGLLHSWLSAASAGNEPASWGRVNAAGVHAEAAFLEERLRKPSYPVVLCHNDVQSLNIIVVEERAPGGKGRVRLIDLEYAAWNYAYFDIANHFCEHGGLACDYSLLPEEPQQRKFIRSYIEALEGRPASEEVVERWRKRVCRFILASHLLWGIWALFQARETGNAQFDYVAYAEGRFRAYEEWKEKLGWGRPLLVRRDDADGGSK
eukprot:m51a1_g12384 putative ethanolamine kinase 2 (368) ;mRNA; f:633490-635240